MRKKSRKYSMVVWKKSRLWVTFLMIMSSAGAATERTKAFVFSSQEMFTAMTCEVVIDRAFHNLGFEVGYQRFPSARALIMSNGGDLDGETCRILGADNKFKSLVRIPHSIMGFKAGVFVNRKLFNKKVNSWDELYDIEIGIRRGHLFYDKPTSKLDQNRITKVSTDRQLLDMVEIGHIPVAVLILYDALEILAQEPEKYKSIAVANDSLESHDVYLYIHKKNMDYYDLLTEGIGKVVTRGEAKIIRDKAEGQYNELLQRITIQ